MNILHAASELYPLLKTGGLADVLGALPFAQQQNGDDVRVILPYYRQIREQIPFTAEVFRCDGPGGYAVIRFAEYRGLGLYLIDAPHLYDRGGNPYHDGGYRDYPDNVVRFGLLGWAAAAVASGADPFWNRVDVLHAHDWQAGLAPAYLKAWGAWQVKTVFTTHNIAYQGLFDARHMSDLWLPWEMYRPEGLEFRGQISFLKAGLYYADHITTVSPTYAREITVSAYGMEGLLQQRQSQGRLSGILNGVGDNIWHPAGDHELAASYGIDNAAEGKAANKAALQQHFGLKNDPAAMLCVMVSRLTEQKGADFLLEALYLKLAEDPSMQFVLLGSGAPWLEQAFNELAQHYPERVGVHIGYDEQLAHRLIGGGDVILVPSRFEPCGLTQLYGLKYGTLPLVRRTGGLADTVAGFGESGEATGFVFGAPDAQALAEAFNTALYAWSEQELWEQMRTRAMQQDFGWLKAAQAYRQCYQ
ncbi:glycogen synthase GlgA [Neisseria sp. CCUG12390]|uniref:glycogen synthase GlgA n=1 Tax=Neisseria sp. CCUG12390 TaxID=3392035 RepID=UPI003A0FB98B